MLFTWKMTESKQEPTSKMKIILLIWIILRFNVFSFSWSASSHWTAETNSNFKCERGHPDNLNTGQRCTQESAKTFFWARCLPRSISTWFIHLETLWMCIIPGWSEETEWVEKVKSLVKSRLFTQLLVYYRCFLSATWESICSSVLFCFLIFIFLENGLWGTRGFFFFQNGLKFMQP